MASPFAALRIALVRAHLNNVTYRIEDADFNGKSLKGLAAYQTVRAYIAKIGATHHIPGRHPRVPRSHRANPLTRPSPCPPGEPVAITARSLGAPQNNPRSLAFTRRK
jgi:hypothetical protein